MSNGIETRLERRTVHDGHIRLDVDRVRLSNGEETAREVVRHPGAVAIAALHDDGRLVLIRQYRYAVDESLLEVPAGTLERGEAALACAQRELAEETGYAAGRWTELGVFFTTPGFTDEKMHLFLAQGLSPTDGASPESDESIELAEMPLSEALAAAEAGRLHDAKTLVAIFQAARRLDVESGTGSA